MTFWFPINQVKGHLTTPKRSPAELPGMKFYYPSCLWASGSDRSLTPPAFEPRGVIEAWAENLEVSGLPFSFKILLLTVLNLSPKIETQQSQGLDLTKSLGRQVFDFDFFAWLTPHGVLHGTCGNSWLFRSLYPSSRGILIRVAERKRIEQESTTGGKNTYMVRLKIV